jgi:hypothetical protein
MGDDRVAVNNEVALVGGAVPEDRFSVAAPAFSALALGSDHAIVGLRNGCELRKTMMTASNLAVGIKWLIKAANRQLKIWELAIQKSHSIGPTSSSLLTVLGSAPAPVA